MSDWATALRGSGARTGGPLVWAGDGSKLIQTLPEHGDSVRAVAISPDGGTVATANNPATDGQPPTVRLFNTQTWRDRRLFGHTRTIYALAISDDGQLLASAGFDKTVRLWDTDSGSERGRLVGHTQQVNALAFGPDRRTVVSAGSDGTAVVWQTAVRTHEPEDLLRNRDPRDKTSAQQVLAVGVGGRGTAFVVADDAARVRMFVADFVPPGRGVPPGSPGPLVLTPIPFRLPSLKDNARAAAASTDGRQFVVAVPSGLLVWQPLPSSGPAGQVNLRVTRAALVKTPDPVHAVGIDPADRWIVTADAEGVRLYDRHKISAAPDSAVDLKGGELVLAAPGVSDVAFHPTRDSLAVAVGTDLRIVTFRGQLRADVPRAHGLKATVESVAFDAAGETVATGDANGLIKLWALDPSGGLKFLRDLPGHTSAVYALAFSPDGRTLASGGDDRMVFLWDPVAGQERLALAGHADRVLRVAFNADGTALVTVGRDGAVKRWRADVRQPPEAGSRLQLGIPSK